MSDNKVIALISASAILVIALFSLAVFCGSYGDFREIHTIKVLKDLRSNGVIVYAVDYEWFNPSTSKTELGHIEFGGDDLCMKENKTYKVCINHVGRVLGFMEVEEKQDGKEKEVR